MALPPGSAAPTFGSREKCDTVGFFPPPGGVGFFYHRSPLIFMRSNKRLLTG